MRKWKQTWVCNVAVAVAGAQTAEFVAVPGKNTAVLLQANAPCHWDL